MLHLNSHDSHVEGGLKRWDQKPVKPTPHASDLDPELVGKIRNQTQVKRKMANQE